MINLNLSKDKNTIPPIERIADVLKIDKHKAENEEMLGLLIRDKISELKKNNNKNNIEKLKYKSMYEVVCKQKSKEVIHKNANVKEYEKEIIRLKKINLELNMAIEGLKQEIKMYKNDRISKIVSYTYMNKKDEECLL